MGRELSNVVRAMCPIKKRIEKKDPIGVNDLLYTCYRCDGYKKDCVDNSNNYKEGNLEEINPQFQL